MLKYCTSEVKELTCHSSAALSCRSSSFSLVEVGRQSGALSGGEVMMDDWVMHRHPIDMMLSLETERTSTLGRHSRFLCGQKKMSPEGSIDKMPPIFLLNEIHFVGSLVIAILK